MFCIWFTGVSGSGKTTLTNLFAENYDVKIIDGDELRQEYERLDINLGFTRLECDFNVMYAAVKAIAALEFEIPVIVSLVSPFNAARNLAIGEMGRNRVCLVHLYCDLKTLTKRDPKMLYSRAMREEIEGVAGLDAPYEAPLNPDVSLDTGKFTPQECFDQIVDSLRRKKLF